MMPAMRTFPARSKGLPALPILFAALWLLVAGCRAPQHESTAVVEPVPVEPPPRPAMAAPVREAPYQLVRGLYATDRNRTESNEPNHFYGPDRSASGALHYGTFQVSIPKDHRIAEIERPSLLRFEFNEDPSKHVVLVQVRPRSLDDFKRDLADVVFGGDRQEILVFIHGYNVSFDEAARRLGQLVYDLEFRGAPILYSWPSQAEETKYTYDEAAVEWTIPHLEKFLADVVAKSNASAVHLVAHSMGNRALTRALQLIARRQNPELSPLFRHIIMAAPDIDAGVFRELAREINTTGNRLTLYASSNDKALQVSKKFHGYHRAGESGTDLVVVPNVDTIDVSGIDTSLLGHSYYGDNTSVVSDLRKIILLNQSPSDRCDCLVPRLQGGLPFWVFQP